MSLVMGNFYQTERPGNLDARPSILPNLWRNDDFDLNQRYHTYWEDDYLMNRHRQQMDHLRLYIFMLRRKIFEVRMVFMMLGFGFFVTLFQCRQPKTLVEPYSNNVERYITDEKDIEPRKTKKNRKARKAIFLRAFDTQKEAYHFLMNTDLNTSIHETESGIFYTYVPVFPTDDPNEIIESIKERDIKCTPFLIDI
jgi:hypothetical protein